MDKAIKESFKRAKKEISKEEKGLIKKDIKRDKMCAMKSKGSRGK